MLIKVHIERDFSFMEFEIEYNFSTGEGLPPQALLQSFWERLPGKPTPTESKLSPPPINNHSRGGGGRSSMATAAQRRLLERYGQWREGLTQEEASALLTSLGF